MLEFSRFDFTNLNLPGFSGLLEFVDWSRRGASQIYCA